MNLYTIHVLSFHSIHVLFCVCLNLHHLNQSKQKGPGLNILFFRKTNRLSSRNDVKSDKVNSIPDIRQNLFFKKEIRTSRVTLRYGCCKYNWRSVTKCSKLVRVNPLARLHQSRLKYKRLATTSLPVYYPVGADTSFIYTPSKTRKTLRFLKFSGVAEKKHWLKTGYLQNSREVFPSRTKNNKVLVWYNILLLKHKENFISKLSIKMFIKRKTRAGKAVVRNNCVRCETAFVGCNSYQTLSNVRC